MKCSIVSAIAVLTSFVAATPNTEFKRLGRLVPPLEAEDPSGVQIVALANDTGSAFFDQILDHDDLSKGTFKQKFWWNTEFWGGPGSPVSQLRVSVKEICTKTLFRLSFSLQVKLLLRIMVPTLRIKQLL